MRTTLGVIGAPTAACIASLLVAGCTATAPIVTVRHDLEPPAVARAAEPVSTPAPQEAPSTDDRVAALAGKYYGIEATVEGLVSDVQALDARQAALQTDLRAIEGRIGAAETSIVSLTDKILARFDSFESHLTLLRDELAQAPAPAPVAAAEAAASTAQVLNAVKGWREAWQQGPVSDYMSWYHPDASVTRVSVGRAAAKTDEGLGLDELRARMQRLRARYSRVDVAIDDVQVTRDGNRSRRGCT